MSQIRYQYMPRDTTAWTDISNSSISATARSKESNKTMAKNLEALRAENPELANQLLAEAQAAMSAEARAAVETERKRLAEIDEISAFYDEETVQEAKYGDNPCTAQKMAFRATQKVVKQGKKMLGDLEDDYKASGAAEVSAAVAPIGESDSNSLAPEQRMAYGRADARKLQKVQT